MRAGTLAAPATHFAERLWHAARELLLLEVAEDEHQGYVTAAHAERGRGGPEHHLVLSVPSRQAASWLRDNLQGRIEELVGRPHNLSVVIRHVTVPDLFNSEPAAADATAVASPATAPAPAPKPTLVAQEDDEAVRRRASTGLAPDLRFDNFVSGPSNDIAFAATLKLASEPGAARTASPLYIHGAVGLGKTHLAHALGNHYLVHNPGALVRVLSGEQFMREVQNNFLNDRVHEFRSRFRRLNLLILDDIQMIGRDSEQTHRQFLGLFNYMTEKHLPIVITSDRPSSKLNRQLPPRLLSRVAMGLDVSVSVPDFDTRVGILQSQAHNMLGQYLPDATARLLASRLRSNCRELIGALRRLSHYANYRNCAMTPEIAAHVLRESTGAPLDITPQQIIERLCRHYSQRPADLRGKSRHQRLVRTRHLAMFLCRELTEVSLPEIGNQFNCHHSSVLHACRKIARMQHEDRDFAYELNQLRQTLEN